MPVTLEPARWLGGPTICQASNLPAFDSPKAAADFRDANCPGGTVVAQWTCTACGKTHFWGAGFDPAGATSGTTRTAKHLDEIKARFLQSAAARTMPKTI